MRAASSTATWSSARRAAAVAITAAIAFAAGACAAAAAGTRAEPGARPADFALVDIDGHRVHLSDYLGDRVILINFWATWCGPCAGELPHLQRLYDSYADQGFVVLAVAMDGPDSVAEVRPFARRHELTFPVLVDEDTRVLGQLNPKRAAPYNILIGRDGRIVQAREGYSAGDEAELERAVQRELRLGRAARRDE